MGHIERSQMQHDKDLVMGKIGWIDLAGIVSKVQLEGLFRRHLFKKGAGSGNHFLMITGPGSHYEDVERLRPYTGADQNQQDDKGEIL
jgi:hypothetical protein